MQQNMLVIQQAASSQAIIGLSFLEQDGPEMLHDAPTTTFTADKPVLTGAVGKIPIQNNYIFIFMIKGGAKGGVY